MTDNKCKKSYFKRFQTKLRRRREGKTDYKHRVNMIRQDANKHGIMKIRLVVRITNTRVICDVVKAHVDGDRSLTCADSLELKKYGINFGLTNYTAAYATGLLAACRYFKNNDTEHKPRCFLDIGLSSSSKGARVFAAMKGAVDGGLDIPHSMKKFPGYDSEKPDEFDSEIFRDKLFGKTLARYMNDLMDENPEKYKRHFQGYIKKGVNPKDLEGIYEMSFKKIRENPERAKKTKQDYSKFREFKKGAKLSLEERKVNALSKVKAEVTEN